jgi:predicted nucleotide-binding protein
MTNTSVRVPDIEMDGVGITRVIEILVNPGDIVKLEDTVAVLESDIWTMDVPSLSEGIVSEVLVSIGQEVKSGSAIVTLSEANTAKLAEVFLVHGRNDGLKETVARCIEKLGLTVSILHEKPNEGQTIIEKFEGHADVKFAVVVMTADDRGGLSGDEAPKYRSRARQNVVFELGYFLGLLGRKKVCALYEQGVEMPSDYSGVLFIELDDRGAWRYQLAKELHQAKLPVDLNKLLT